MEESFISLSAVTLIFAIGYIINISSAIGALTVGIVLANPTIFRQSDYFKRSMFRFWDGVSWIFELFAFILVGALFTLQGLEPTIIIFAIIISFIVILARFLGIFLITLPLELFENTKEHFNTNERLFVSFAGMKGLTTAILALMAYTSLIANPTSIGIILNSTIMFLIATGLFQGIFLKPFASKTNVMDEIDELNEIMVEQILLGAKLDYLVTEFDQKRVTVTQYRNLSIPLKERLIEIRERILVLRAQREQQHKMVHLLENQNTFARNALTEAKVTEEIDESAYNRALNRLDKELETFKVVHESIRSTKTTDDESK